MTAHPSPMNADPSISSPDWATGALPMVVRDESLPDRATIYEVGPRDGLQNESATIDTADKVAFIRRLIDAGLPVVEATSFVHPTWVPQLADAAEVTAEIDVDATVPTPVLVPTARGLDRAQDAGCTHIAVFASATETIAQKNLNSGLDEQFDMFKRV